MTQEVDIPLPVRFNLFKHHRDYILSLLESASAKWIANQLDPVFNNYIDIYTGSMTPEAISHAVIDILKSFVSGKILFGPYGTMVAKCKGLFINMISLRDCPFRDSIFIEPES